MRLARFWTRAQAEATDRTGEKVVVEARGWSDDSIDSARACALEIARKVADRVAAGFAPKQRYPYGDRPLPEPVIREFRAGNGEQSAVVTRNAYGVLVLNANQLMFVDIDRGEEPSAIAVSLGKMFSSLFGKPKSPTLARPASDPLVDVMNGIAQRHDLSGRVYQTAGGYRVMITSVPFVPGSPTAQALLAEFGCDPLYVRLCDRQETFRARLTPKPWRCAARVPPVTFPFETADAQSRYDRWESDYDAKTASSATCRFLSTIGAGTVADDFNDLMQYHDDVTKAASSLRLA